MRPRRIKVEGFASYRSPVEVDLGGVEFFSLSGATGSGKSSLVDAMVFALYGRIPKLGARAVAPVISVGAERARVAFDFDVAGATYTAVRLVQRSKGGGASVKEARLQKGEEVVADGASDVTAAVEELLRLRFEDFTRTVVLPQGEFARFLTADKAERQSLLRNLLGLDIYTEMRSLARARESVAKDRVESALARLEGLEIPGDEAIASARARLYDLETLAGEIVEREKTLAELVAAARLASDRVGGLDDLRDRLERIEVPDRLEELDALVAVAEERASVAMDALEAAEAEVSRIEAETASIPSLDVVASARKTHSRMKEMAERLDALDQQSAESTVEAATLALEEERRRAAEARGALEEARQAHAAHSLASTLVVGSPCPVCAQDVESMPDLTAPTELAELEDQVRNAETRADQAADDLTKARTELAALITARQEIAGQLEVLREALTGAPDIGDLDEVEERHRGLERELETARADLESKRAEGIAANKELEDLADAVRSIGRGLMAAHQSVAELTPPVPESDDPFVQWKEFLAWREGRLSDLATEIEEAKRSAEAAHDSATRARARIVDDLVAVQVPAEEPYAVGVTRELQRVKSFNDEIQKSIEDQKELESGIAAHKVEAELAGALAAHLKADGFERWLMAGAIADLVAGANDRLVQLSKGGFSLDSDESGSFSIVDHHNANESRSVATLSGGETFLVSLSLALSLAETLAARGGAELETIIIDEGFGTLDDESLDTVASVLEELAGGLMVGVITHVKELAGRAPTRFEVVREPGGSRVEEVS